MPEKEPVAVALLIPVATVVLLPLVGRVPAFQPSVKVSLATVAVQEGKVPTAVMELTVAVLTVTEGVILIVPTGV